MKKQCLPLAMLTSFLAAAAGAVIWGLMYFQGWFVGYIALLSLLASGWCYLKFYYKLDWKFYVWNISVVVILNLVSSILCDVLVMMSLYDVTFGSAFSLYQQLLSDASYRTMYILNLISNLIFSAFGIGLAVYIFRGRNYIQLQVEKSQKHQPSPVAAQEKISASAVSLSEVVLSEYVQLFKQKNPSDPEFMKKRQEIEKTYLNDLPENTKSDMIKYIASITPGSPEEENAIKLLMIKLK